MYFAELSIFSSDSEQDSEGWGAVVTGKISEQGDPTDLLLSDDAAAYQTSMILPS